MRADLAEISIAARLAGMPAETIRFWERRGIIVPTVITVGGQRLYDNEAITRLRQLRQERQAARRHREEPAA